MAYLYFSWFVSTVRVPDRQGMCFVDFPGHGAVVDGKQNLLRNNYIIIIMTLSFYSM